VISPHVCTNMLAGNR